MEDNVGDEYNTDGLPCPSCGNNMHFTQTSGILSKTNYHQCTNCFLKFKENNNFLTLEEEPEFTRMHSKLHLKRYTLDQWKEILRGKNTPDFAEEFSKWTINSATNLSCPACNNVFAEYKSSGFASKYYLICSRCGLTLEKHKNNQYLLYECNESYSPLWKYEKNLS